MTLYYKKIIILMCFLTVNRKYILENIIRTMRTIQFLFLICDNINLAYNLYITKTNK